MRRVDAELDGALVQRFLTSDIVIESSTGFPTSAPLPFWPRRLDCI